MKIIMQNGIQIELFLYLCTDECVSPSLKSPIETWVYMEAQTAAHIYVDCPSVHIDECLAILYEV